MKPSSTLRKTKNPVQQSIRFAFAEEREAGKRMLALPLPPNPATVTSGMKVLCIHGENGIVTTDSSPVKLAYWGKSIESNPQTRQSRHQLTVRWKPFAQQREGWMKWADGQSHRAHPCPSLRSHYIPEWCAWELVLGWPQCLALTDYGRQDLMLAFVGEGEWVRGREGVRRIKHKEPDQNVPFQLRLAPGKMDKMAEPKWLPCTSQGCFCVGWDEID